MNGNTVNYDTYYLICTPNEPGLPSYDSSLQLAINKAPRHDLIDCERGLRHAPEHRSPSPKNYIRVDDFPYVLRQQK